MSIAVVNETNAQRAVQAEGTALQAPMEVSTAVLVGKPAIAWMQSTEHAADWDRLYRSCPWGTAFQTPGFAKLWFRHYGDLWTPVLVLGCDRTDRLIAIMPLAARGQVVTGVGAHQAEYQGWLSAPPVAGRFVSAATSELTNRLPGYELRLKYLHADVPQEALDALRADRRVRLRSHVRGVLDLDKAAISDALKKKGNRSKLNRLRRLGSLEFRVLSPSDLERHMDDLTAYCDFRQGAVNDSCPFTDDLAKRRFHLDWLRDLPDEAHVSGMFLNDRLISALFLGLSAREAHIAILAHAPEHAENSPNKFHIYEAALALAGSAITRLDMTPGGDEWKLRFATRQDTVHELVVYANDRAAWLARYREEAGDALRRGLSRIGLSPSSIRRLMRLAARSGEEPEGQTWLEYRVDPTTQLVGRHTDDPQVNALPTLLNLGPGFTKQSRHAFLSEALHRMEAGERAYSIATGGALQCLAWADVHAPTSKKDPCLRLSAIRFAPSSDSVIGRRAVLGALLRDAAERHGAPLTTLAVKAADRAGRGIVESAGFVLRKP